MAAVSSIRPLPADVLSQIRSSVVIASLNDVVLNLLKNSLDGNALNLDVAVDYGRGSCSVEDDGIGIEPIEFSEDGGLGKMHHTSKYSPCAETHGGRGSFLALLSALSLVSITSHHSQHRSHNTISMHRSKVIARQIPTSAQHRISDKDHGTRVTVRDLFGSMPVRARQRTSDAAANDGDWQSLRKSIVGLLLAWPNNVSITIRNVVSSQIMKIRSNSERGNREWENGNRICSILSQAMFITPSDKEYWVLTTGSTPDLIISGTISTEPCPHKNVQFLSYHIYPMADCNGSNLLYDHVNRLFAKSSFGSEEDEVMDDFETNKRSIDARYKQDGYTGKQLKSGKKGANRWPMFCLKIESRNSGSSLGEEMADEILDEKRGLLTSVIELLEKLVVGFLKEHHFRVVTGNRSGRRSNTADSKSTTPLHTSVDSKNSMKLPGISGPGQGRSKKRPPKDLAMNIKMPSLSRETLTTTSESPFHSWTRVKRGQVKKGQEEVSISSDGITPDKEVSFGAKPRTPSTPSQVTKGPEAELLATSQSKNEVSMSHTELERHSPCRQETAEKQGETVMEQAISNDDNSSDEDLVAWINPISMEKSLVSRRTGMVVCKSSKPTSGSNLILDNSTSVISTSRSRQSLRMEGRIREEPSTWVSCLLSSWDNPVFRPAELPIPQVSMEGLDIESQRIFRGQHHNCTHLDIDQAFKQSSGGLAGRLTKDALQNAEVISQVDKKFILIKLTTSGNKHVSDHERNGLNLLVLVDQHAADERCRLEELLDELCKNNLPVMLETSLSFQISNEEIHLFRREMSHFRRWGISYEVHDGSEKAFRSPNITVKGLPSVILERCRIEPSVLINLMRVELWKIGSDNAYARMTRGAVPKSVVAGTASEWFPKLRDCPEGILDMLNSRACRSAIMFNDKLDAQQCKSLIARLSHCAFPFQCAHGRPSMMPLVDMSTIFKTPPTPFSSGDER